MNESLMQQAIDLAIDNVRRGGGPFGALVVKDGIVIAAGANQVTRSNDPTAHAEVVAIREACRVLGDFQLSGGPSTGPGRRGSFSPRPTTTGPRASTTASSTGKSPCRTPNAAFL